MGPDIGVHRGIFLAEFVASVDRLPTAAIVKERSLVHHVEIFSSFTKALVKLVADYDLLISVIGSYTFLHFDADDD